MVPSVRRPHPSVQPLEMAVNRPSGEPASTLEKRPLPQHSTVPSVRNPHESNTPAETAVNPPSGASDCPRSLPPQQCTVPSVRNPHE